MNAVTRLRVKLGAAEIDYEGNDQFLKDEIMPMVGKIVQLIETKVELQQPAPLLQLASSGEPLPASSETGRSPEGPLSQSTSTIAAILQAKSATDLALAAAAHLTLVQQKDKMTRQVILTEMKGATGFYKSNDSTNLSSSLRTLVKQDKLRSISSDTYALANKERTRLEKLLAEDR
jgi:hypothetical protein